MFRIAIILALVLCSVPSVNADTYRWTDDKGAVNFTDDPGKIPDRYRMKAQKGEDITIRNPKVQQELKAQEEKARQEENNRPRIAPTTDYVPPPLPAVSSSRPNSDELPPGRPKSQRIRENVERREAEEKALQQK
jgi:hypothetical protein